MKPRGHAALWKLADPLGVLDPARLQQLAERHGLERRARRRPPLLPLPEDDSCVSGPLYGTAGRFDALPFPNMEWWWNTIELDGSDGNRYFVLTNVHSFGTLLGPPSTCATVAVFDVKTGRRCVLRSNGKVSGDGACTYVAPGWLLQRLDPAARSFTSDVRRAADLLGVDAAELHRASGQGCYVVRIDTPGLAVRLYLEQHTTVLYGDRAEQPGWFDNNPGGEQPYWASYRSRFETPRGALRIGSSRVWVAALDGNARFDHQSVHWSVRDNGIPSGSALLERLGARLKWLWYHGRLSGGLNIMAYKIWNSNTKVCTKVAAAIVDERTGEQVTVEPAHISFGEPTRSGGGAVVAGKLGLAVKRGASTVPAGAYDLTFAYDGAIDWTVDYAVGRFFVYRAHEAYCTVSGTTPYGATTGTGTQEILDLGDLRPASR